jgi:hypothetical protein
LLLVPVYFLDGVVDIDQGEVVDAGHDRCYGGEVHQPPGGGGVELADVAEQERTQERSQR